MAKRSTEQYTVPIGTRVTPEDAMKLATLAREQQRNQADTLRWLIRIAKVQGPDIVLMEEVTAGDSPDAT